MFNYIQSYSCASWNHVGWCVFTVVYWAAVVKTSRFLVPSSQVTPL